MPMVSRFFILFLFSVAVLTPLATGAAGGLDQDKGAAFSRPAYHLHGFRRASRSHRFDLPKPSGPAAMQNVAIEDSDENSTGRSRAEETRSPHYSDEASARMHRPRLARASHSTSMPDRSLLYRLCKLLI